MVAVAAAAVVVETPALGTRGGNGSGFGWAIATLGMLQLGGG